MHKKGKESYGGSDDVDKARKGRMDEWEAWCDPGSVCWRYGAWEWFDAEFDPVRSYRGMSDSYFGTAARYGSVLMDQNR